MSKQLQHFTASMPAADTQQLSSFDFSESAEQLSQPHYEFCDLSEVATQHPLTICILAHAAVPPLAHIGMPSGWAFCTALDEDITVTAEQVAALQSAIAPGAGPLKLVWCVPPRLWPFWQALMCDVVALQQPLSGRITDFYKVQLYALLLTV